MWPFYCVRQISFICSCHGSDVGYETYKSHRQGPTALEAAHFSEPTRLGMIAVKRSVFQSIASMYVLVTDRRSHVLTFDLTSGLCLHSRSIPL